MEELVIDNVTEKITRYVISELSVEIYPENKYDDPKYHLYEGVVPQEEAFPDEWIEGIYKTEDEAKKAFEKYETEITECGSGVKGLHVTEYYLHGAVFDLGEAIKDVDDINSEEDFDKQLKEDYVSCEAQNYHDVEEEWVIAVSPMNIVVAVFDEENRTDTEKYVLFHTYNDAVEFEDEFLDNCDMLKGGWVTKIYFNSRNVETISEEEFKDWFKDYNDLGVNKKREVKCRL